MAGIPDNSVSPQPLEGTSCFGIWLMGRTHQDSAARQSEDRLLGDKWAWGRELEVLSWAPEPN